MVERGPEKAGVDGSTPPLGTTLRFGLRCQKKGRIAHSPIYTLELRFSFKNFYLPALRLRYIINVLFNAGVASRIRHFVSLRDLAEHVSAYAGQSY